MGSLSLLQQIFPTQESNQSLLHCRQILYQLSYEGSFKVKVKVSRTVVSDSTIPWTAAYPAPLSVEFSRLVGTLPSAGDLPNPGTEPRFPTLQADSLPVEPQGKPKNTEVGSLSLLQWIFLTQESNWGLLHCRQILYQLALREAPKCRSVASHS